MTCPPCRPEDTIVLTMQNGIPWWYFQSTAASTRAGAGEERRPERRHRRGHPCRARHRLRRLSGVASCSRRAWCATSKATASPWASSTARRARASSAVSDAFAQRRLQGAGAGQHPRRDLAQALGQPDLQPDQRADPRHAGRHLPVPADARARREHDARGAGRGRTSSASPSGCRWKSASPAPRRWASTRPRCCRTSRPAARPRSTRWSAR